MVFVFDDIHWIEEAPELREVMSLLIERAPSNVHFLLASRTWPSLSCLPKLAVSDDLCSLDMTDLRFSTEETARLLTNLWKESVSDLVAEEINQRTGGWAAGIVSS